MTMMCNLKVGDVVSVEPSFADKSKNFVGKISSISENKQSVSVQVTANQMHRFAELRHCWYATPTQKKAFFKAMLQYG